MEKEAQKEKVESPRWHAGAIDFEDEIESLKETIRKLKEELKETNETKDLFKQVLQEQEKISKMSASFQANRSAYNRAVEELGKEPLHPIRLKFFSLQANWSYYREFEEFPDACLNIEQQ
jgi:predicted  nucleic acid-binding Zn-ribbon protein